MKDLKERMKALGITLASNMGVSYDTDPASKTEATDPWPLIQLPRDRYFVADVDSDQGLGEFHRLHGSTGLPGLGAYVLTNKGVLLVYHCKDALRCTLPGDPRYELISEKRGTYDMRVLSKVDGKPRTMQVARDSRAPIVTYVAVVSTDGSSTLVSPIRGNAHLTDQGEPPEWRMLAETWTELARQAAGLGVWVYGLRRQGPVKP